MNIDIREGILLLNIDNFYYTIYRTKFGAPVVNRTPDDCLRNSCVTTTLQRLVNAKNPDFQVPSQELFRRGFKTFPIAGT